MYPYRLRALSRFIYYSLRRQVVFFVLLPYATLSHKFLWHIFYFFRAEMAATNNSEDIPKYQVPEAIFQLIGPTEKAGNSRYKCKLCIGSKSISASNKSRVNLRNHLKSQHTSRLKSFDEWCSSNDKRKRKTDSEDVEEIKASKLAQPTISGFMSQRYLRCGVHSRLYSPI